MPRGLDRGRSAAGTGELIPLRYEGVSIKPDCSQIFSLNGVFRNMKHLLDRRFRRLGLTTMVLAATLVLGACATAPTGPTTMVLPGSNKSFDAFRLDDMDCRQYASMQGGGAATEQARTDSTVKGAVLGTAVGAVAGAAIGGSRGAGVGAGTGLLFGTVAGTGGASGDTYNMQRRYDHAYLQCMYAKGHRVPVDGRFGETREYAPPVRSAPQIPPPPAGMPPPPPPGLGR